MRKSGILSVALASLALVTSCSQEDLESTKLSNSEISFHTTMGLKSRATEVTGDNITIQSLFVSAFENEASKSNYMSNVEYTYNSDNSKWSTTAGTFFWPASSTLHFYAYSPEITSKTKNTGTVSISQSEQKVTGFTPYKKDQGTADAEGQVDFIYANTSGNATNNATNGVSLTFKHALSQIVVKAKNENTAYQVKVNGVKIGGVYGAGDFTFPSTSDTGAGWSTTGEKKASYCTEYQTAVELTSTAANVDDKKSFMLIPQQLAKDNTNSKASAGSYLALKVTITMKSDDNTYSGQEYYSGYAYVGLDTKWEMGKKYTYIVDFTKGAGQKEDGSKIFGDEIEIKVNTVNEWDSQTEETVKLGNTAATTI